MKTAHNPNDRQRRRQGRGEIGQEIRQRRRRRPKEIEEPSRNESACGRHPKVKELSEAVGDAKTPEEKVKRIVAFVHGYVRPSLSASDAEHP
ncbi:MAG: hypothetical protein U0744_01480 [Gemmataceae bacterium]